MKLKVFTADGASSEEKFAIPAFEEGDKGIGCCSSGCHRTPSEQAPRQRVDKDTCRGNGSGKKLFRQRVVAPRVRAHVASHINAMVVLPTDKSHVITPRRSIVR